jgi:hypothetical protein
MRHQPPLPTLAAKYPASTPLPGLDLECYVLRSTANHLATMEGVGKGPASEEGQRGEGIISGFWHVAQVS